LQVIDASPGMVCHFLPKFHPEMNSIEYFWAWIKRFRERSNGQWKKAQDNFYEMKILSTSLPYVPSKSQIPKESVQK
jgi:hypothetical protein